MAGIKINAPRKSLQNLNLEIVARDQSTVKYRTENGNDFSVTVEKGKVVYMENDWLQDEKGRQPLFSDFSFGETSLKEIRAKFSTNGFVYKDRSAIKTDTHLVMFNCFEFDSKGGEVLVTISKISLDEAVSIEDVADKLKLDALIIASKSYLDVIWGKEKSFDKNYKKINP